jgi:hypothetical protein
MAAILEVSPANTLDEAETEAQAETQAETQAQQHPQAEEHAQEDDSDSDSDSESPLRMNLNEHVFSTESSSDGDNGDTDSDGIGNDRDYMKMQTFSQDSQEDDNGNDDNALDGGTNNTITTKDDSKDASGTESSSADAADADFILSEFDKALSLGRGKPSRGTAPAASSYPPPPPPPPPQPPAAANAVAVAADIHGTTSTNLNQQQQQGKSKNKLHHHRPPQPPPIPASSSAASSSSGAISNSISAVTGTSIGNTSTIASTSSSRPKPAAAATTTTGMTPHISNNNSNNMVNHQQQQQQQHQRPNNMMIHQYPTTLAAGGAGGEELSGGVLPDVLMNMRQKIESMTLFDSDMMKLATLAGAADINYGDLQDMADPLLVETRENLKRSSQQSISAAVLVSLAHKRYERRRLAAMEIEKVVRSLVQQDELERVRAILLLLSDDYVRSTSEDARKGGVVALAASAIGLKKAQEHNNPIAQECRDLILASVVHACQDHSQRVRYYATESLFNVVKVIPVLAVQHFFILFEILRSLYADVDLDVRSGAELLDKKLKEVIVGAMNSGSFTADACVPVFARFVYMRNKATKRLTLTWLQELNEKLIGSPILEFLHLFLGGIFDMVADPTLGIRQSALAFLQSVLPKLLVVNSTEEAIEDIVESGGMKVDFDKILQSLVTTMEHPDPFVRKVAMYWMSRIVKAHIGAEISTITTSGSAISTSNSGSISNGSHHKNNSNDDDNDDEGKESKSNKDERLEHEKEQQGKEETTALLSAATISVRNSLPHVLPGILLSIGDTFHTKTTTKDSFLPDQTTHALAEQTNKCLQDAVRCDGKAYVQHLDGFIVALREELDSPGGLSARNPPAVERKPYRMDVKHDGTGIESQGWFRTSNDIKEEDEDSMMLSRLCALHWVIVLYESVVPDVLKADVSVCMRVHILKISFSLCI